MVEKLSKKEEKIMAQACKELKEFKAANPLDHNGYNKLMEKYARKIADARRKRQHRSGYYETKNNLKGTGIVGRHEAYRTN